MCRVLLWGVLILSTVEHGPLQAKDTQSLQRGAQLFMNYCSGCHSLQYLRYSRMAQDLALLNKEQDTLKNNLIAIQARIVDPVRIALPATDAQQWFGVVPPDLSLITRQHGSLWIYDYLRGFYYDAHRPFRSNNILVPNVAMPDVLAPLRSHVSEQQFNEDLLDLVHFLAYVGEPQREFRIHLGIWVVSFLIVFCLVVWCLKRA